MSTLAQNLWLIPPLAWGQLITRYVPSPYLDEIFHVPQAQKFCQGDWSSWDPKITTPPGLYITAAAGSSIIGCTTTVLRAENGIALWRLTIVAFQILKKIQSIKPQDEKRAQNALHNAINIALFSPLFFFSGLYYTDVASTLTVLTFWLCWLDVETETAHAIFYTFSLCVLGLMSLAFRQTNIFWVAIFPAAFSVLRRLNTGPEVVTQSMYNHAPGLGDTWLNVMKTSWKQMVIYDPVVVDATVEDYIKCILSVAACALAMISYTDRLRSIFIRILPNLILISVFIAFVVWNGSVVLGDKSNHVATLHLPQMLYIWPYFLFFSWPLLLPNLIWSLSTLLHWPQSGFKARITNRNISSMLFAAAFMVGAALIIKLNTIVHPFTLADNRHYTFYVFRLLMRPWWMRYAVIPIYGASAWLCIRSLGNSWQRNAMVSGADAEVTKTRPVQSKMTVSRRAALGPTVSFVMIWLATSALQLITAPLVEPRYFILPWIFWRLYIPASISDSSDITSLPKEQLSSSRLLQQLLQLSTRYRLWIETFWLITINLITGYIFLHWTFKWPSEPQNLQRFMW